MAQHKQKPADIPDIKVFIRNVHGQYLAGAADQAYFTDNRSEAIIVSYRTDRVPEQIEMIRKTQGIFLVADPVPLEEIYEKCDTCGELFSPLVTFFDGSAFTCPDCRKPRKRSTRHSRKSVS
jgi:hypothetical protein